MKREKGQKELEAARVATTVVAEKRKVLLVKGDDEALRLLVVWPLVKREVVFKDKASWDAIAFSFDEWCAIAGLPPSQYNFEKCDRLINWGLVFPDGSLHYWIDAYIQQEASMEVRDPST